MAVTINDMQVDVEARQPAGNSTQKATAKEKPDLRREMEMRTERELRLRAD
jgi:hypothetical protein